MEGSTDCACWNNPSKKCRQKQKDNVTSRIHAKGHVPNQRRNRNLNN